MTTPSGKRQFMQRSLQALALAAALCTLAAPGQARAEGYPDQAVTLVPPVPPGATRDVAGPQLAERVGAALGQSFIIVNKAGASTIIGASYVARAPKDGYTLLLSSGSTFTTTPHLIDHLPYSLDDFAPV